MSKPIDKEELKKQILEMVSRITEKRLEKSFRHVFDSNRKEHALVKLAVEDILYFEYLKRQRRVNIVTADEIYEYETSFEDLAAEFKSYDFEVSCQGFLVNLRHIVKIAGYRVHLDTGEDIAISQRRIGILNVKRSIAKYDGDLVLKWDNNVFTAEMFLNI